MTEPPILSQKSEPKPTLFGPIKQFQIVIAVGLLLATLFSIWTPSGLVTDTLAGKVPEGGETFSFLPFAEPTSEWPTPTPRPRPRIGIVAGHWQSDSGAVCSDGLEEVQVNLTIASFVKQQLVDEGFDVDLLEEFDDKLQGYRGLALVSIHADSCEFINNEATGYKVAAALSTTNPEKASRLTSCLRDRYARYSELPYHPGSITPHMTQYHIFSEIHNETTAAIIETGFLNQDRIALTTNPEKIATGITRGILCFIYNESVSQPNVEADE